MPEIICEECGKRLYHENEDTLKIEQTIHEKFCRKKEGETHSYMHRDTSHTTTFDAEREYDVNGTPVLKK
ncbi:MAG: hypothetical protein ACO2Y5_05580 [Nitrosopumilaceae archaeon]|uniref:Uncharacterized protein n=1 Tax=Candidatus Nitrosomaritimum aestuariumsis TaxID=3342354 RepID=A0AC60W500_9ARCH|nr:hypothetical protein [Nitrosopumilaceae archaeon]